MTDLARIILADDALDEPTLWLVVGDADPQPILNRRDLTHSTRHLWPVIAQRVIGGEA